MLGVDKMDKLEFCDNCLLCKQHIILCGSDMHNLSGTFEYIGPFEYIHTYHLGMEIISNHGVGSYFLTMVGDLSRRVWVHI